MNIDLGGRQAWLVGAKGTLTTAIRDTLTANGASVSEIDAGGSPVENAEPFVLVLVSDGANGLPDSDAARPGEREEFVRVVREHAPKAARVVTICSAAGLVPVRGFASFSADQASLVSLTRALAMELGPATVVNGVAVGAYEADGDVRSSRFLTHTGVKRAASLDEILAAVLFLADPDNGYMTGHTLSVDGGWTSGYARNF